MEIAAVRAAIVEAQSIIVHRDGTSSSFLSIGKDLTTCPNNIAVKRLFQVHVSLATFLALMVHVAPQRD